MKILEKIWAVWMTILFVAFMFVALPVYIIGIIIWKQKAIQHVHFISRMWAGFIFALAGIPWRVKGTKPSTKEAMVLISNHQSALDIPFCALATGNPFRFLSKAELGKFPILGWIIRNIYLTVDRKNAAARQQSFDKMGKALAEGSSVFIYPEGTRNKTAETLGRRFHEGAFRLAVANQVPVAVLAIYNSKKLCPPSGFNIKPGLLRGEWLAVLPTKGMNDRDVPQLMKKVRDMLHEALELENRKPST